MSRVGWLLLASLAASATTHAQGIDMSKGGPIEVTSRDGIEWRQADQVVIARGDARAVRGDNTVIADSLTAHYRKKAGAAPAVATPAAAPGSGLLGSDTGSNEIYRLEATGHVKMFTPTDIAAGDHATYDIDQAVLVLTGNDLKLTTPNQVMTARDTMEYWSVKHMAVGRGLATVTTSDGRRITADVLVGYTNPTDAAAPARPQSVAQPAKPGAKDPLGSAGKLQRVEAFGHVEVRTATETITGDRAVYVADSGISRIVGNVSINRGLNHAVGDEAIVNMQTGVSRLIRKPGNRVEGLIVPGDASAPGVLGAPTTTTKPPRK